MLGILTIFWEIADIKAQFDLPMFWVVVIRWFRDRIFRPPTTKTLGCSFTRSSPTLELGLCRLLPKGVSYPTIDARIEALEDYVRSEATDRINSLKKIDDKHNEIKAALHHEEQLREEEDGKIRVQLRELGTGGLHNKGIGGLFLLVGAFLCTFPNEIANRFFPLPTTEYRTYPNELDSFLNSWGSQLPIIKQTVISNSLQPVGCAGVRSA